MTRTLKLSTGTFDQDNTFNIALSGNSVIKCSLHRNYQTADDGVYWGMNTGSCLKSSYTDEDSAERNRLTSENPVNHGDTVTIDGSDFHVRILGRYSDAVIFDPA